MTDWGTVAIAAISALAGVGGSAVAGRYSMKALDETHTRDDSAKLRDQVHTLFQELDAIEEINSRNVQRGTIMVGGHAPETPLEAVNFGNVRAITSLYFPNMNPILEKFTQREIEASKALRKGLEDGGKPMVGGGLFALERAAYITALCSELRAELSAESAKIGASIRQSIDGGAPHRSRKRFLLG